MGKIKGWSRLFFLYGAGWTKDTGKEHGFIFISTPNMYKGEGYRLEIYNKGYRLEIYNKYFGGVSEKPNITKYFKTMAQAEKAAVNYMRRHP